MSDAAQKGHRVGGGVHARRRPGRGGERQHQHPADRTGDRGPQVPAQPPADRYKNEEHSCFTLHPLEPGLMRFLTAPQHGLVLRAINFIKTSKRFYIRVNNTYDYTKHTVCSYTESI